MKLLRLHIVQLLLMALVVLSATTSCYNYDQPEEDLNPYASRYINITVAVSTSEQHGTRAPLGGEYGDAIEKGTTAENKVSNITLVFYEDATGINTTSDDAAVVCVKTYDVTPVNIYYSEGHEHAEYETPEVLGNEVVYTTGDQRLDETTLVAGKTYKVLVAANVSLPVNVGDKIKTVRELLYSNSNALYTVEDGTPTNFVMTSESDATVSLTNPTQKIEEDKRFVYNFNCIHIERLAARIDYNTSGADYDDDYGGYKYSVGTGDGFFVVTKVTPFNLYNESEYFFKRVRNNWTDVTPAISWLGYETTTNYVADPNTGNKDDSHTFSYLSPVAEDMNNGYTQTMSTDRNKDKENIVISYARENTLMPTSPLKKYATGLAFEIKYYVSATATPVTRVYYHYLRHQGELSTGSYQTYQWNELSSDATCGSSPSMKYGIVRNNIYRVTVSGFTPEEGDLKITIEEKHWRHVDNPTIYI